MVDDDADIEKDVFTPEQIGALVAEAQGDWKGAIIAGYYTGLRLKDVTELRWESVDPGLTKTRTRTAQDAAEKEEPQGRVANSSGVRSVVKEADARHRQGAGVSNVGGQERRRQERAVDAVQAHHGAR